MDALHAAIATFPRSQHPTPPLAASGPRVPQPAGPGHFVCRFCRLRVVDGQHGEDFHFRELWEAVSCAACHRERLRPEARAGGAGGLLRQAWHSAGVIRPRCRRCGEVIDDGNEHVGFEELQAARECADCHPPVQRPSG
jgi:hypothetical protein